MREKLSIEEITALWQREANDDLVFRAATEDINEYPPEVQVIIKKEAERRRMLKAEEDEKWRSQNAEREKQEAELAAKPTATKIAEAIGILLSIAVPCAILNLIFGSRVWGTWCDNSGRNSDRKIVA